MTEAYRHDEIAKLAYELWERNASLQTWRMMLTGLERDIYSQRWPLECAEISGERNTQI